MVVFFLGYDKTFTYLQNIFTSKTFYCALCDAIFITNPVKLDAYYYFMQAYLHQTDGQAVLS